MAPLARFAYTYTGFPVVSGFSLLRTLEWMPKVANCAHEDAETTSDSTRIPTSANSGRRSFTYVSYHCSGGIVAVFVYNVPLRKYSAPPLVLEKPVQQHPAAPSQTTHFLLLSLIHI